MAAAGLTDEDDDDDGGDNERRSVVPRRPPARGLQLLNKKTTVAFPLQPAID